MKSKRIRNLIIVIAAVVTLCCAFILFGSYLNSTPEGQATSTARAQGREATRVEQTAVAAIAATEEAHPTDTPIPTDTAIPTDTPAPTNTAAPTATPRPTNTAVPEQARTTEGLGISRSDVLAVYTQPEVGFTFEESTEVGGQPRTMGTSPSGTAVIELIGPSNDLMQISVMAGIPSDNDMMLLENAFFLLGMLNVAVPEWDGGVDWVTNNIEATAGGDPATTTYGNRAITLSALPELGFIILTIKVAE